jgi:hypothetical protein
MTGCNLFSLLLLLSVLLGISLAGTRPEDVKWLAEKAKEAGVVTLPSGLLYKGMSHVTFALLFV